MMNYDVHIHTQYCGHAEGMTIPAIIARANALGLKTIAITDHVYSENELPVIEKIARQVKQIPSETRVIVGVEMDTDGTRTDGSFVCDPPDGIDLILAGTHYIPGDGKYPKCPEDNPLSGEELLDRWRTTLLGTVTNPTVTTLVHPGRMIAVSLDLDIFFDDMLAILAEAAPIAAQNDILWEINELDGKKLRPDYHDQWHRIYQIALDAGVKLIYGSDAHSPDRIAESDFVEHVLKDLPAGCLQSPETLNW